MKDRQLAWAFMEAKKFLLRRHRRGFLPRGRRFKECYICLALEEALMNDRISYDACERARTLITRRIEHRATIESWLVNGGYIDMSNGISKSLADKIQAYRHAWLDSLIKEFS